MKKRFTFLLILTIIITMIVMYFLPTEINNSLSIKNIEQAYPSSKPENQIIKHSAFHLSYNENCEQADWVAYILTRKNVEINKAKRTNRFKSDLMVNTGSASTKDYSKSGYDRGHLAPAADMNWSKETMRESFFMSNMSPQKPKFNRGIWKQLEGKVREWAVDNDSLFVITGPVLDRTKKKIGKNEVAVPNYFYKVILDISAKDGYKAIAFLLENKGSKKSIFSFAMSVDELETFTGIDFFENLNSEFIEKLESKFDTTIWN